MNEFVCTKIILFVKVFFKSEYNKQTVFSDLYENVPTFCILKGKMKYFDVW